MGIGLIPRAWRVIRKKQCTASSKLKTRVFTAKKLIGARSLSFLAGDWGNEQNREFPLCPSHGCGGGSGGVITVACGFISLYFLAMKWLAKMMAVNYQIVAFCGV
jgi:hypothetical protein